MKTNKEQIIQQTQNWVQQIVIGLNFCPFAKPVFQKESIRYVASDAQTDENLVEDLIFELQKLIKTPEIETTLLIHPFVLQDFETFNDFLALADAILEELDLLGIIQIASFHPDYCFADAELNERSNFTNRSPYPTLHLLREESISKALQNYPNPEDIFEQNMQTLEKMNKVDFEQLKKHSSSSKL